MADDSYNCPYCGNLVKSSASFCPGCGAELKSSMDTVSPGVKEINQNQTVNTNNVPVSSYDLEKAKSSSVGVYVMVGLLTFFALIGVIVSFSSIGSVTPSIIDDATRQKIIDAGLTVDQVLDMVKTYFIISGVANIILMIMGGLIIWVTAVKKHYGLGMFAAVLATILSAPTVVGLILGLLLIFVFYEKTKPAFIANAA